MIIVDTSVWIEHVKVGVPHLSELLLRRVVLFHDFIELELRCGVYPDRDMFFAELSKMPRVEAMSIKDIVEFIERNRLYGQGCGGVDLALLAVAALKSVKLWTRDKRLSVLAEAMGVNYL